MASRKSIGRSVPAGWLALLLVACAHGGGAAGHGSQDQASQDHTPPVLGRQIAPARPRLAPSAFIPPSSYAQAVRGELHASRNELPQAIAAFQAAIELGENDPLLLARLAELQDRAGDHAGARHTLQAGLQLAPHSEALFRAAARIARAAGNRAVALAAYERAEAFAESPSTAFERIEYLRTLGNAERALAALEQLWVKHRQDAHARTRIVLELTIARQGSIDPIALVVAARDWLALGSSDPDVSRRAAHALLECKHPELALQLLEAVPVDEGNAALRMRALLELGRLDDCAHLLATTQPTWLGGPVEIAQAELQANRPDAALAALQERDHGPGKNAASDVQRGWIEAQALIATGEVGLGASKLAPSLRSPALQNSARDALGVALRASALPALAREVARELASGQ